MKADLESNIERSYQQVFYELLVSTFTSADTNVSSAFYTASVERQREIENECLVQSRILAKALVSRIRESGCSEGNLDAKTLKKLFRRVLREASK